MSQMHQCQWQASFSRDISKEEPAKPIILCGLPMCGKTTVGRALAEKLAWKFVDIDQLIEEKYARETGRKASCREIFKQKGESFFRLLENQAIISLRGSTKCVVALGGGSLLLKDNIPELQRLGAVIYLKLSFITLWERLSSGSLPAYLDPGDPKKSFEQLAQKRMPLYAATAHIALEIEGLSPDQIISQLENALQSTCPLEIGLKPNIIKI